MVSKDDVVTIDEGIKVLTESLSQLPQNVRTRVVSLRANPGEVISRIQQINGLVVEFEERV